MRLLPPEIARYFEDSDVTDILINNETEIWVERHGAIERGTDLAPGQIDAVLEKVLAPLGRRLDRLSPTVDARLPDGTRMCAVIHPIAVHGTCVAFRLFRQATFDIAEFFDDCNNQNLEESIIDLLRSPHNILITGSTGSGKTSLLASLISEKQMLDNQNERIIVIEDTHELVVQHPHLVRLETRAATADGRGQITMDDLLRSALRLRPDRLVVGEVRGIEALTLVQAMNTGHSRSLATLHANSAIDGLHRLDLLTMQAAPGWTLQDARHMVDAAVGIVIHMARRPYGKRIITQVARVLRTSPQETSSARLEYLYRNHDA